MVLVRPWRVDGLLRLVVGVLIGVSVGSVAASLLEPPEAYEFWRFLIATLSFHLTTFACVHVFLQEHHDTWGEAFGLRSVRPGRTLGLAAGVTLLALPCAWAMAWASSEVIRWFQVEPVAQQAVVALQRTAVAYQQGIMASVAVILAPAAEELIFRGVLYGWLKGQLGSPLACVIASAAFASIHFNLMSFVPLVFLAVIFTWLYEKTGNLLAPVFAHGLFNLANVVFLLLGGRVS